MTETNELMMWIPLASTLLGALIGFGGTFLGITYSKNREDKSLREQRNRERIENLYEILIQIRSETIDDTGKVMSWIHTYEKIKNKEIEDIPPLISLEMYVNLYFPELEEQRLKLIDSISKHGQLCFDSRIINYRKETLEVKQNDAGAIVKLSGEVENEIKSFQNILAEKIEA